MKNSILIFGIFIILLQFILEVSTQAPAGGPAKAPPPAGTPSAQAPSGGPPATPQASTPAKGIDPKAPIGPEKSPSALATAESASSNDMSPGSIVGGIVGGLIFFL